MMPAFKTYGVTALVVLAFGTGFGAASAWKGAQHKAQLASIKASQAQADMDAARADLRRLERSQQHADAITAGLQTRTARATQTTQEVRNALESKTTGTACLSGGAVRLLNNAIASDAGSVPAPAAGAAGANGATAADTDPANTGPATDTHIAHWANHARERFAVCRARLDALIDFHTPASTGTAP